MKQLISEERKRTVHFVASGRLHPQKGFDRLISSLSQLDSAYDWQLSILGDGDQKCELDPLIQERKLSQHVKLIGQQRQPWPFYARADCFLLPSRFEGLPNVALEALACGTPVIATDTAGGIAEIAALSAPKSVTVVKTMEDFIQAMNCVQPSPLDQYSPSLLPQEFEPGAVKKRFEALVEDVLNA